MGETIFHTYTCDHAACPGDGTHAGPFEVIVPDPAQIPTGWLKLQGGVDIIGGKSIPATALFHSIACLEAWYQDTFLPALLSP